MHYTESDIQNVIRRQGASNPPPSSDPPSSSSSSPPSSSSSIPPSSSSSPPPPSISSSNPISIPTPSNSISNASSNIPSSTTTSSTPPPASTPVATTVISTQIITTDAQGSSIIIVSSSTTTSLGPVNTSRPSGGSHVGAIVGGAVGGVAGLALLFIIAWLLARRRKRNNFNGDFDPDSVVGPLGRGKRQSLDGPTGAEVTPFVMNNQQPTLPLMGELSAGVPGASVAGAAAGAAAGTAHSYSSPSESAYPQSEASYLPNPYPASSDRSDYPLAQGRQDYLAGVAGHPSSSPTQATTSIYSQFSQPRSAKEREAYQQRYGMTGGSGQRPLMLANSSDEERPVIVHQDGGRINENEEEEQAQKEIPPTYDSLPDNERH